MPPIKPLVWSRVNNCRLPAEPNLSKCGGRERGKPNASAIPSQATAGCAIGWTSAGTLSSSWALRLLSVFVLATPTHPLPRPRPPRPPMQLVLSLLSLASLSAIVQAAGLPVSPQTSLQDRQKAREVYQRRQANAKDIIRRRKDGPSKRQSVAVLPHPTRFLSLEIIN